MINEAIVDFETCDGSKTINGLAIDFRLSWNA